MLAASETPVRTPVIGTHRSAIHEPVALVGVGLCVLLGLAVRLYGITSYGVWFDEAYHVQLVQLPTVDAMLDAVLSNPPSDPLYVLILRLWVGVIGSGDLAIRLLPALLSTATIPATFLLGKELAGLRVGLGGAFLLAVSPYAVELGQEGALYALASLATTLALFAAWRYRRTGTGGALFVVLGVTAIYSHYVVAVILGLVFVAGLFSADGARKAGNRNWIVAHATIFALWLPWLVALLIHWLGNTVPRVTLGHTATPDEVWGAMVRLTSGSAVSLQERKAAELLGVALGAVLLIAGWWAGKAAGKRGLQAITVVSGLVFIVPAILSGVTGLWLFVPHFMIFLLPAILCVVASGIVMLWDAGAPRNWAWTKLLGVGLAVGWLGLQAYGLILYNRYPPHGTNGLRELAATINSNKQSGDPVYVTPPILMPTIRQYYTEPLHGIPSDFDLHEVYAPYSAQEMFSVQLPTGRFWLVYRPDLDKGGQFITELRARYRQDFTMNYAFADLYLFVPK